MYAYYSIFDAAGRQWKPISLFSFRLFLYINHYVLYNHTLSHTIFILFLPFSNHTDPINMKSPFTHAGAGLPENDWQPMSRSSSQVPHYLEKPSPEQKARPSKRRLWRLFRLGFALILVIAGLVLNLIILVDAGGDLSLLTVSDMSVQISQ